MSTYLDRQPVGLRFARVEKTTLLERLTENREKHRDVYEKAMDGYKTAVTVWFAEQLDKAKGGRPFEIAFREPVPEDHTEDYDRVIDMLSMSLDEEIEISQGEFQQYVRDDWGWKREWEATTSNYLRSRDA